MRTLGQHGAAFFQVQSVAVSELDFFACAHRVEQRSGKPDELTLGFVLRVFDGFGALIRIGIEGVNIIPLIAELALPGDFIRT